MVERIKINPTSFKVSKPGYDVNSATGDQLAFDANNGYSYAGIIFSGTEDFEAISPATVDPWSPYSTSYTLNTTTRRRKDITFASKGITRTFSAPPGVIFMVKKKTWSGYATPSYCYVQQAATFWQQQTNVNWDGNGTRTDSNTATNATSSGNTWAGGAVWASCSIDGSGYGTLTIRLDRNDFATSMPTDFVISYIVFQNFTGLPTLTAV